MRTIDMTLANAFMAGVNRTFGDTHVECTTYGCAVLCHNVLIVSWDSAHSCLRFSLSGHNTRTAKSRINGIMTYLHQKVILPRSWVIRTKRGTLQLVESNVFTYPLTDLDIVTIAKEEAIEYIKKEETPYTKYGVVIKHDKKKNHLWVTLVDATPDSQDFVCRILKSLHAWSYLSQTCDIVCKKNHDKSFPQSREAQVPDKVGNLFYLRIAANIKIIKTFQIGEPIIFTGVDMKFYKYKDITVVSEEDLEALTFDRLLAVC